MGKISQEQRAGCWEKWATDLVNPNFAEFAKSCDAYGNSIHENVEVDNTIQELMKQTGPGLLEVQSDVSLI